MLKCCKEHGNSKKMSQDPYGMEVPDAWLANKYTYGRARNWFQINELFEGHFRIGKNCNPYEFG